MGPAERPLELFQIGSKAQTPEYPSGAGKKGEAAQALAKESSAIFFLIIEIRE